MTIRLGWLAGAGLCLLQWMIVPAGHAETLPAPTVYTLDPQALAQAKNALAHDAPVLLPAYRKLVSDAGRAMTVAPLSVTAKGIMPPSGDKHDYLSMAPYWWPDATRPNGLPYMRRDGRINPSTKNNDTDSRRIETFSDTVGTLGMAYYFTGERRYAERAALLLRTWFLDPATRMNPNLEYAQAVMGVNNGRGTGIIDTRHFWQVIDTIGIITPAGVLSDDEQAGLKRWFTDYTHWMMSSKGGRDEAAATNNHGSYFDEQLVNQARYIGDDALARSVLSEAQRKRYDVQIRSDGRQPLELVRTRAFHYSVFNLQALTRMAHYGQATGVDLWAYPQASKAALQTAVDYLAPYVLNPSTWPYTDIQGVAYADFLPVYLQARRAYGPPADDAAIVKTLFERVPAAREWLYWPVTGASHADAQTAQIHPVQ
ncbi:alginate lyase family protein [Pandoraea sp. NPDC087047]|uniref:alginate lyase family protein n=1 Tax=Pandoraea sp. NPDC087047 TaxID=3364390 RepID=UPI00381F6C63